MILRWIGVDGLLLAALQLNVTLGRCDPRAGCDFKAVSNELLTGILHGRGCIPAHRTMVTSVRVVCASTYENYYGNGAPNETMDHRIA